MSFVKIDFLDKNLTFRIVCNGWKSLKKSHLITFRAKRATFSFELHMFEFSRQKSAFEYGHFGAKIQIFEKLLMQLFARKNETFLNNFIHTLGVQSDFVW